MPEASGDFSVLALFMQADAVVKFVMFLLIGASVLSWAVIFSKWFQIGASRSQAKRFEKAFWGGQPIDELTSRIGKGPGDALARVFSAGAGEWKEARRLNNITYEEANASIERADRLMKNAIAREISKAEGGLGLLATIGSASPFIGLFGTVWGIMNSFRSIAAQKEANLAVVAPGISEALFATALGLVAAIPAVVFYNALTSRISGLAGQMDQFSEEFGVRLSRRLMDRVHGD